MSIKKLNENMNIISALDDEPNDEGGLSSAELKSKFDEGAVKIKSYINESLIPDVDSAILEAVSNAGIAKGNMPLGGKPGQALFKRSNTDFDTEFADLPPFPDPLGIVTTDKIKTSSGSGLGLGEDATVEQTLDTVIKGTIRIGNCETASSIADKVVTLPGYVRTTDSIVGVTFLKVNSAELPTLNVNGTGAAEIKYIMNKQLYNPKVIGELGTHLFMFDGTYWQLLNPSMVSTGGMVWGTYTGDGTESTSGTARHIVTGFPPCAVLVWRADVQYQSTYFPQYMGLGLSGSPAIAHPTGSGSATSLFYAIQTVTTGFYVRFYTVGGGARLNENGAKYHYIAWR